MAKCRDLEDGVLQVSLHPLHAGNTLVTSEPEPNVTFAHKTYLKIGFD